MSRISKLTKLYKSLLNTHFVAVQAVQTGILMGTGDVIAQTLIEKKSIKNLNRTRTLQFMALGTSFVVNKLINLNITLITLFYGKLI